MNKDTNIKRIKYCNNATVVKILEYSCVKTAVNGMVKLVRYKKKEQN
jgi:hypothetical protein